MRQGAVCHLHDGEEGVQAIQVGASWLHRHANDWQGRERCDHAGQVCCAPCSSDDHLHTALTPSLSLPAQDQCLQGIEACIEASLTA